MKPLLLLALLALAACRTETAALPDPVPMTEDVVGHYCQMNLFEHPGPKAQVHLDGMPYPIFFSQVRDGIAYQRMPEQDALIAAVYVNDMGAADATWDQPGSTNWIPADEAFFVVDSGITGGMGAPELVPFAEEADARAFATREGGEVLRLPDIADEAVLSPVDVGDAPAVAADDSDYLQRLEALDGEG